MVCQINLSSIYGEVVGYKVKLHPKLSDVIIKLGNRNIKITVDSRQTRYIRKEYPIGSLVELKFDGNWHIVSQYSPCDFPIEGMDSGAY
jgi:hypothetical protein